MNSDLNTKSDPSPTAIATQTVGVAQGASTKNSYGQILKSSALIGGASVLSVGIGIVRTKAMALLLGPAGVGLMGLYSSISDLTQSIAGMGINSSGVRQIAEAVGSNEAERIARTVTTLRRIAILLGVLGAALFAVFSRQVSRFTFGSDQHAAAVALLSLVVLFRLVSDGRAALVQGLRRISDLARMGVLGALFGTAVSIAVVYFLREKGIVPALVSVAAITMLISLYYSRRVAIQVPVMTTSQMGREASALLKLGFAFMASAVLTMGAAYAIRTIVLRKLGFEAAGLYQAAWALGGLYVGFILQAMGADFYPRLTAVSKDNPECNRLVNEQALVSLLLAGPGVIATITFAPVVIALFYTHKFEAAIVILRWICLGMALRVIAWPMGFIILAKGIQSIFLWTEVAAAVVHVGLALVAVHQFGLVGAGVAFFGLYAWHGLLIYLIVRRVSGFRWSAANRRTGLLTLSLVGLVFCGFMFLPVWLATVVGTLAALICGVYSLRVLLKLVPRERIPPPIRRLLARCRFAPPSFSE